MADKRLDLSREPGGAHHLLARLAGGWSGTTRTWFEPDQLADQSPTRGRMRTVLDGRFVVHEYEGSLQAKPLFGMAVIGYHIDAGVFTVAWIDSFHMGTGTMQSTGRAAADDDGTGFDVLGQYEVPEGPPWGWRTTLRLSDDDKLSIVHFNISPAGDESKAVEIVYTREGV